MDRVPSRGVAPQPGHAELHTVLIAAQQAGERSSIAEGLQAFKLHVSALQGPLVTLLQQHGTDKPGDGAVVREDAHDIRASLDLGVQPLERVGAVDLQPMRLREVHARTQKWGTATKR
jgi:hypothetical protein